MSDVSKETGVLAVLAKRMVEERLPRALELKERVDRGEVLADSDIAFLEQVLADARRIPKEIKDNPKLKDIGGRMLQLYNEIMARALANESNRKES